MDPQGRILLEQTGLAFSDATPEKFFSSFEPAMGVYVGVMHMEYIQFMSGDPFLQVKRHLLILSADHN